MQDFVKQLMEAAKAAGIEECEAYVSSRDSFRAMTTEGEVVEYESNLTRGLGFRGLYRGRMGYASTEAFDEEAVGQLVRGVLESAELCEDEDEAPLYDGGEPVPDMDLRSPALAQVTPQEKIDRVLAMEKLVKESDPRIDKTAHNVINTGSYTVRIVNSHGMDRSYTEDVCALYGQATAKDGAQKTVPPVVDRAGEKPGLLRLGRRLAGAAGSGPAACARPAARSAPLLATRRLARSPRARGPPARASQPSQAPGHAALGLHAVARGLARGSCRGDGRVGRASPLGNLRHVGSLLI